MSKNTVTNYSKPFISQQPIQQDRKRGQNKHRNRLSLSKINRLIALLKNTTLPQVEIAKKLKISTDTVGKYKKNHAPQRQIHRLRTLSRSKINRLIALLQKSNLPQVDIAEKLKLSRYIVHEYKKNHAPQRQINRINTLSRSKINQLTVLLKKGELSQQRIAKKLKISLKTINKYKKILGDQELIKQENSDRLSQSKPDAPPSLLKKRKIKQEPIEQDVHLNFVETQSLPLKCDSAPSFLERERLLFEALPILPVLDPADLQWYFDTIGNSPDAFSPSLL